MTTRGFFLVASTMLFLFLFWGQFYSALTHCPSRGRSQHPLNIHINSSSPLLYHLISYDDFYVSATISLSWIPLSFTHSNWIYFNVIYYHWHNVYLRIDFFSSLFRTCRRLMKFSWDMRWPTGPTLIICFESQNFSLLFNWFQYDGFSLCCMLLSEDIL